MKIVSAAVNFPRVLALLLLAGSVQAAPKYVLTDLGTLGGNFSQGGAINDAGQVAGMAHTPGNIAVRAGLAYGGVGFQDLGTLGGSFSTAAALNLSGQATGTAALAGDQATHAFRSTGNRLADLGTLGGTRSRGLGINGAGDVTGAADIAGNTAEHAFLYRAGSLADLGTLGGANSQGNDLNDAGQVTGWADLPGSAGFHGFIWSNGLMAELPTLGGSYSEGRAINAAGQVTGYATLAGDLEQRAVLWQAGQPVKDLGSLGGSQSAGLDINAAGRIVGFATVAANQAPRAVVWNGTTLEDLNGLILPGKGWVLTEARGISDSGLITGIGTVTATDPALNAIKVEPHAFLLTPDSTAPAITCPNTVTTKGDQPLSIGQAVATDLLDPAPVIASNRPASFPLGETLVTWTATDAAGNVASCKQAVRLPALRINDVVKAEGNAGVTAYTFTVTLAPVAIGPVTVNFATANSSAVAGSDYAAASGSLTFTPGQTSQSVTVNVTGDTLVEANEVFAVNLSGAVGAAIADAQGLGHVVNDEGPRLSVNDLAKAEGNAGTTAYVFTVSLAQASAVPVTVSYGTANSSAVAGSDYSATSGSLTFTPGQTIQTFAVNAAGDTAAEPNEAFVVNLSNATGATIFDGRGVATLLNDDGPLLRINDVARAEGNAGINAYTFTVSLSPAAAVPVTVNFATANSSALAGSDYTAVSGSLSFAPGQTSKTITVNATGDTLPEANEAFVVNLSAATGATIFDSQGVGTLLNDEGPLLRINDVTRAEGNAGVNAYTFTVSLSPAAAVPVTANWATANSSALAGSDFTAAAGSLSFAPGQTSKTVTVNAAGDTLPEANEAFVVNLSAATGATIFDSQGVGTLVNDEGPLLRINDVARAEGNAGVNAYTFTVSLSPAAAVPVTVNYATANSSASAGSDYTAASGSLSFAPGQTSKTVTVNATGDTLLEANEAFVVNLSAATGATIFDSQGVGTLVNDDL